MQGADGMPVTRQLLLGSVGALQMMFQEPVGLKRPSRRPLSEDCAKLGIKISAYEENSGAI